MNAQESADRQLLGVCLLATLPRAGDSTDELCHHIKAVAAFHVPKRTLTQDEVACVSMATATLSSPSPSSLAALHRPKQGAASIRWSEVTHIVSHHCWTNLVDVLHDAAAQTAAASSDGGHKSSSSCSSSGEEGEVGLRPAAPQPRSHPVSPFVRYPTAAAYVCALGDHSAAAVTTDCSVAHGSLALRGDACAALLESVTATLAFTVRADMQSPLTAAALALSLTPPSQLDAGNTASFVQAVFRSQLTTNTHGRVVCPTLPLLHAINAIVFNATTAALAAADASVMGACASSLDDLMQLAVNEGKEEKRGLMLSTALWLNHVFASTSRGSTTAVALTRLCRSLVAGLATVIARLLVYGPVPLPFHAIVYDTVAFCIATGRTTLVLPGGVTSLLDARVMRAVLIAAVFRLQPQECEWAKGGVCLGTWVNGEGVESVKEFEEGGGGGKVWRIG